MQILDMPPDPTENVGILPTIVCQEQWWEKFPHSQLDLGANPESAPEMAINRRGWPWTTQLLSDCHGDNITYEWPYKAGGSLLWLHLHTWEVGRRFPCVHGLYKSEWFSFFSHFCEKNSFWVKVGKLMGFEYNWNKFTLQSWKNHDFREKMQKYQIFPTLTFTFNFGRNWFTCNQKQCFRQFFQLWLSFSNSA